MRASQSASRSGRASCARLQRDFRCAPSKRTVASYYRCEGGAEARDDFKGRKVISEVISEHERENGKSGSSASTENTVFLSSTDRASLSDGDYASGVQLCARAQCIIIKRPGHLNTRPANTH